MGPMSMDDMHTDGPKFRNTNTPTWSKCTCFGDPNDAEAPYASGMIPSPLGRGLPSRWGFGKSF